MSLPKPNPLVYEVLIEDYDERNAPPSGDLLRVAAVVANDPADSVVFLDIGSLTETVGDEPASRNFVTKADIGVHPLALLRALIAVGVIDDLSVTG